MYTGEIVLTVAPRKRDALGRVRQCSMVKTSVSKGLARAEASIIVPHPYKLFSTNLLRVSPPKNVHVPSGFQLFLKVADYNRAETNRQVWTELEDQQKEAFENPGLEIHQHFSRIQSGYRSAASSADCFNPFYNALLFPWEIIKDKLRHKPLFATDIYDQLINEALKPKKERFFAANLYYSDVLYRESHLDSSITAFDDLPPETRAIYRTKLDRKLEFYEKLRRFAKAKKRPVTEYDKFIQQNQSKVAHHSLAERNKALAQMWKQDQLSKTTTHIPSKTRAYRERSLDIKTCIVMDYIFEIGAVEDFHGCWRTWKHEVMGGAHYFRGAVFPYMLQRKDRKVTFIKDYSEFDNLASWLFEATKPCSR